MNSSRFLTALSLAISVLALLVAGYSSYVARSQLQFAMSPSIVLLVNSDPDDLPVGIQVANDGLGPATIKAITFFVDKKPIGDVGKLVDREELQNAHSLEIEPGETLGAGKSDWLLSYTQKPRGKDQQDEFDRFLDLVNDHLAVEIEYCPARGECAKKCSTAGWCE